MAESTLSLGFTDFMADVADYLGWGRDSTAWGTNRTAELDAMVQSGYRQFLYPPVLPGQGAAHRWWFLQPTTTLVTWVDVAVSATTVTGGAYVDPSTAITATVATFYPTMVGKSIVITGVGTFVIDGYTSSAVISVTGDASAAAADTFSIDADGDYRAPDDFGGIRGNMTFAADEGWIPLQVIPEGMIRSYRQHSTSTGRPRYVALQALSSAGATGQRFNFMFWPEPDDAYTLSYQYNVLVAKLATAVPYPLGGMQHAETVLQSCLAVAENRREETRGPQWERFMERLTASITVDAGNEPVWLGYNGDESDMTHDQRYPYAGRDQGITYEGTLYT